VSDGTPGGSGRGLRGALAELGASLLGLAHTRLELVAVEFDEVRERTIAQLVLLLAVILSFAFALLAASTLVVVFFWDTHPIAALCAVALAYLLIGLFALWRLSVRSQADAPPFAATLAEFERDRAWLTDRFGGDP
jgi:uncharacterized membrane protein YqjE